MNFLLSQTMLGTLSAWDARLWYAVPLIVVVSLVYGATRHEMLRPILEQSLRSASMLSGFMLVILVLIWLGGYWN